MNDGYQSTTDVSRDYEGGIASGDISPATGPAGGDWSKEQRDFANSGSLWGGIYGGITGLKTVTATAALDGPSSSSGNVRSTPTPQLSSTPSLGQLIEGFFGAIASIFGIEIQEQVDVEVTGQIISGCTKYGINQVIDRGISPGKILDAVKNPTDVRVGSSPGTIQYRGVDAVVVLNPDGAVVTTWPK